MPHHTLYAERIVEEDEEEQGGWGKYADDLQWVHPAIRRDIDSLYPYVAKRPVSWTSISSIYSNYSKRNVESLPAPPSPPPPRHRDHTLASHASLQFIRTPVQLARFEDGGDKIPLETPPASDDGEDDDMDGRRPTYSLFPNASTAPPPLPPPPQLPIVPPKSTRRMQMKRHATSPPTTLPPTGPLPPIPGSPIKPTLVPVTIPIAAPPSPPISPYGQAQSPNSGYSPTDDSRPGSYDSPANKLAPVGLMRSMSLTSRSPPSFSAAQSPVSHAPPLARSSSMTRSASQNSNRSHGSSSSSSPRRSQSLRRTLPLSPIPSKPSSIVVTEHAPSYMQSDNAASGWSSDSARESYPYSRNGSQSSKSDERSRRKSSAGGTFGSLKSFLRASTPALDAAKNNDLQALMAVLKLGTNKRSHVGGCDRDGMTALHWGSKLGYIEIVRALLDHGAHTEARTKMQDRTPLFFAVAGNHYGIASLLIDASASVDAVSRMDGATALHKAAQLGHQTCIELLIAAGADVNRSDVEGMPPLMWATQGKKLVAAQTLIAAGANLEKRIKGGANLELSSREGLTVLHKAVTNGDVAFARLFLTMGADANADAPHGSLALHRAAAKGDATMVQLLIDAGGDVNARTEQGWTPLHTAARYGHRRVAQLLLRAGSDPENITKMGVNVRELAKRSGFVDII